MRNISRRSRRTDAVPHVIVKLWPGKSDDQKHRLSQAITDSITSILAYGDESISVGFEEIRAADWTGKVVEPDILGKWDTLVKQPGYVSP